jgi:2-C-methyl-D-erythritol 2,4-cyclodiphosphate synthase
MPSVSNLPRVGFGHDLHRLQTGGTLILGGVAVAHDMSVVAHSDGDVVLHALVDAILGAIGQGDIGEHFSNADPQWRNARSTLFVQHAMSLATRAGYRMGNIDILILAEKPKLSSFKTKIAQSVADLTNAEQVNVKAGTNEGCDAVGRGEAIAATVTILMVK